MERGEGKERGAGREVRKLVEAVVVVVRVGELRSQTVCVAALVAAVVVVSSARAGLSVKVARRSLARLPHTQDAASPPQLTKTCTPRALLGVVKSRRVICESCSLLSRAS